MGKTSILQRFCDDNFKDNYQPTIGVDFKFKIIKTGNVETKLQIWDTAGQERYRSLSNIYYHGSDFIIMVFDISDPDSFRNLVNDWLLEITNYCDYKKTKLLILGNKGDLAERKVKSEEVRAELRGIEKFKIREIGFFPMDERA